MFLRNPGHWFIEIGFRGLDIWTGYSTRLVVHDEHSCSEFESGGGQKFFEKKGSQVPRNKIGVLKGRGVGSGVRKGAAKDATEAR